ncbi:MAG TPA: HupE/UreJ family protein [Anaeromyxobacteraceae bacterium]|nr:HupE/UreJ family protein [Anaeromyxobacteraceae bacterium]
MTRTTTPWLRLALAGSALLAAGGARAHEFKLESAMTGFVKVEPTRLHLVVRLPLHVLGTVRFPLNGREIDLSRADPAVGQVLSALGGAVTLWEEGRILVPASARGRLALPSDRSFDRYQDAVAAVASPPPPGTVIYADQGYLDAHLVYPIASAASRFSIQTAVAPELRDSLKFAVRFLPPGEPGRAMVITSRSGRVSLDPAWYQAAGGFVVLGIAHILTGIDHLLFLLCLVIPLARFRAVLPIVTAFTVAHSFTLIGAAYGLSPGGAWFPPFVETAIAASIVYTGLENILGTSLRRRWLVSALFGLVHGFGFSYGLRENLQFAGKHLVVSLLSFNAGIELGQIAVLLLLLPALALLRHLVRAERALVVVLSALVAHSGWHWMVERGEVLWRTPWPALDAAGAASLARWVAGLLLAGAAVRLLARRAGAVLARLEQGRASPKRGT